MSNPSPRPPDQRQALRQLFHNHNFKLHWIGQLLFGLAGGVVADRWNRKLTMVGSDLLRGAILLCILLVDGVQHLWILSLAAAGLAWVSPSAN